MLYKRNDEYIKVDVAEDGSVWRNTYSKSIWGAINSSYIQNTYASLKAFEDVLPSAKRVAPTLETLTEGELLKNTNGSVCRVLARLGGTGASSVYLLSNDGKDKDDEELKKADIIMTTHDLKRWKMVVFEGNDAPVEMTVGEIAKALGIPTLKVVKEKE